MSAVLPGNPSGLFFLLILLLLLFSAFFLRALCRALGFGDLEKLFALAGPLPGELFHVGKLAPGHRVDREVGLLLENSSVGTFDFKIDLNLVDGLDVRNDEVNGLSIVAQNDLLDSNFVFVFFEPIGAAKLRPASLYSGPIPWSPFPNHVSFG